MRTVGAIRIKLYIAFRKIWRTINKRIIPKMRDFLYPWNRIMKPSTRIVEYPFIFKNMATAKRGKVLDVGCSGSYLLTELAALGFQVYGIDTRKYLVKYPNVTFIQGDIRKTRFQNGFFDAVTAVSTIEHIGITEYGNTIEDVRGDKKAIEEISRILKPNGILLLTAPYGNSKAYEKVYRAAGCARVPFRIYNNNSLKDLLQGFRIESIEYYAKSKAGYWLQTSMEKAETSGAVVLVKASKTKNYCP